VKCAVSALRFEPNEGAFHSFQLADSFLHVGYVFFQQFVNGSAGRLLLMSEISQSPHFVLVKSEFTATKDELQPFLVRVLIAAIAVRATGGRW